MSQSFTHETYLSPFTWRYGSDEMRHIWSVVHKRRLWRCIWVALATAQEKAGLVTAEQVTDLQAHVDDVDIARAHEIEATLKHDLMAEVHTYAEQCKIGGGIIHLGATSMDVEDNADALRLKEALAIIQKRLQDVLYVLAEQIETHAETVCIGFTHLQPAEPTTVGYRLAFYGQDLLADYEAIQRLLAQVRGKGIKGAVGTSASYHQLLKNSNMTPLELETQVMAALGLETFDVTNQTYPRRQDWEVITVLAGIAMTLYKFAYDLRFLQSPPIGEWGEPFGTQQVGSSAMPFKRNPINAENMDSLARYVATLPRVLWDNAAHSLLERTLDDSANRRSVLPEAFLAIDELLRRMSRLVSGLQLNLDVMQRNMEMYGVFAATERLLMEAVRKGGDRQVCHEIIRQHSLATWAQLQVGTSNDLIERLVSDERLLALLTEEDIRALLHADDYIGDAPQRARNCASKIRKVVNIPPRVPN